MEKQTIKMLGEKIGYARMMQLASELWKEEMIAKGYPTTGVFIPALPCDIKTTEPYKIEPYEGDEFIDQLY